MIHHLHLYPEHLSRVERDIFFCDPTGGVATYAITSLVLSAAATGATVVGQRQAAKAQGEYQQEVAKANNAAAAVQMGQVRDQQQQQDESVAREQQKAANAAAAARATATVSAGEAGVSGNSVDSLLADYRMQEGVYKEALLRQKQFSDASAGQQLSAIRAGAVAGNLSMNAPVAQPNYLAAALSLGAQAAGTYALARPSGPKTTTNSPGTFTPAKPITGTRV